MGKKMVVKSVRMDQVLAGRVASYAVASGMKEADAIRLLMERGLACESLSVFATPVGGLIRDVIEAEFSLLRDELEEAGERTEERVAKVCSKGTKASLQTAAMLADVSRAIIPAWRETPPEELWSHYARAGGELQAGRRYSDVRKEG